MSSSDSKNTVSPAYSVEQAPAVVGDATHFLIDGKRQFVGEQGGNGGEATYQDVSGAPVEGKSPLGYNVGPWSAMFLNIAMIIGTGIFSTPASILEDTGSVGLSLFYWVIGFVISLAGLAVYLELASYFPSRSGAEVVYLEQAYPWPKYFFPVAFGIQSVILSFNSSNAIVVAEYIFKLTDVTGTNWQLKGIGIAAFTLVIIPVIYSTRLSLVLSNTLGVIKVLTLLFITITGFVVLGGHTSVVDPGANFNNAFEGTGGSGYSMANALVDIIFSYGGFTNSFNVANEVKNPIQTIKRTATTALSIVATLYVLVNIAYFSALSKAEILASSQTTASLFFSKIFGEKASKGLTILPVLSALGNILAVVIGQSRMLREIGRQGVLPFPKFWISTRPFGTPVGPILTIWFVTIIVILAPPAGDAFSFIVALSNYPSSFFLALMTFGVFLIRRERARLDLPRPEFRGWTVAIIFYFAANIFLLVMPWFPPAGGVNDSAFGFFYAASSIAGLGIVALCGVYYIFWLHLLPKWGGYKVRQIIVELPDGAISHELVKVKIDDVAKWDARHDPSGRSLNSTEATEWFEDVSGKPQEI